MNVKKQKLKERIDTLYLDKLDGKISENFWQERHNQWTQDLLTVQSNITAYEKADLNFIEQGANFLKICYEAHDFVCACKMRKFNQTMTNIYLNIKSGFNNCYCRLYLK
ncbi:hypothetical protein IJG14_02420 [bacterium]|nr:hypothetical protein [bacterium]